MGEFNAMKIGQHNIIADDAVIEDGAEVGNFNVIEGGTIIKKGAKVGNYCEIGKNNNIGENSILQGRIRIASDCVIEKNVTIKYGTILTSKVLLKEGCFLGPHTITLGSTYKRITKHGTIIGNNTYIGAGSKIAADTKIGNNIVIGALGFVNRDLTEEGIYVGLPVKLIKSNIFTKHPKRTGETYIQHFFKALGFSWLLLSLSFKALVHAVLPFIYESTVSTRIKELNKNLQQRKK